MSSKEKRLVLLDAHAIIHRAYHALPDFSNSAGEPTGALYGIATMIIGIIRDLNPDYMVACFDLPQATYRHEVYKDYKSGRKKSDPELIAQIKRSRDLFKAFGIPTYELAGFEADDLLGTIVEQVDTSKNLKIIIASGDMDTLQLVKGDDVRVYTLKKGIKDTVIYNEDAVRERFNFGPELLPDYKGLRGDPSDNIPGIKGIGEKTATALITNFGTIEKIYKTLKENPKKLENIGLKPRILNLLKENEEEAVFSKMLGTIRRDAEIDFKLPKKSWRETLNLSDVIDLFNELEFRSLTARLKNVLGENDSDSRAGNGPDENHLAYEEDISEEDLKELAVALWLLRSDITNPDKEDILHFANTESFKNAHKYIFDLIKERELLSVFEDIEKPLIPVIEKMNKTGVLLDVKFLDSLSKEYHKELDVLTKKIYKHAGGEFNIKSPKQLAEVLFDKLGLKPKNQKKTSTGRRSTKESELEKLIDEHPIIREIFAYRELQKLLSTYIDNLPEMIASDGRLHTEFLQTGTSTGRLASQNPNLQNIPTKTENGKRVREAFVAGDGNVLLALDYSQIELRIAAILSGDKKMVTVFKNGGDIHSAVAMEVFGVKEDAISSDMRRRAKVINFGILYGMGVNALRKNLGDDVSTKEARAYLDAYFESFSGLASWIDQTKEDAGRLGFTKTLFGRRRYFEGIHSKMPFIRAAAERMAVNAPIQGTSADIIKIAMKRVDDYLQSENLLNDVKMILQVHDELIFECKEELADSVAKKIKEIMDGVLSKEQSMSVPILATIKKGKSWGKLS